MCFAPTEEKVSKPVLPTTVFMGQYLTVKEFEKL